MDFTFSEEQQAAAEAARAVFAGVAPDSVPSPVMVPGAVAEDFDRPLWRRLADADLLGLNLAPEHGGSGLDPVALCAVLREAGAVLARVPLLETAAAAWAVQRHGGARLREEILPRVVRGELVLTVASSGRTGHDGAELAVEARRGGGLWTLDGLQTAVPWARTADLMLIPAHTAAGATVLALLAPGGDGVETAEQYSTTGERCAEVRLDGATVADHRMITADGAWPWLRALLTCGVCALALGVGERVLAMAGDYTGKREQFGHPLATFQAVAMQAADRYIDLRAMEATMWQAAWRLGAADGVGNDTADDPAPGDTSAGGSGNDSDGALPVAADVAVAKIWAARGVRRAVQTAQHLHGGFGADVDYPLHRYHAWAKHWELALGPASAHEEELGALLADTTCGDPTT
ncbi:acyl-CoA dehydrogenase family protein [Streptomyces sp. URMC 123]|uniref:acyl-CoA dehydrogenase family protein n=1 Tax=Streptomyces sp. URMC 123 TaxID=3423403 RepID=UPI003F1BE527